jgi:hypothetical protein
MAQPQSWQPTGGRRHPPDWTAEQQADHRAELADALGVSRAAAAPQPPSPPDALRGPQGPSTARNGPSATRPAPILVGCSELVDDYGLDQLQVADETRFAAEWHADREVA